MKKVSAGAASVVASSAAELTRGVRGRVPALMVAVQRDVQAEILRQAVVISIPKHVRVVACQQAVSFSSNN